MTTTFLSAQMRERDRLIDERHQKDVEAVERKLERVKRSLNDADREIFDLRNRGNQLAQALGFSDIGEAQRAIDISDYEVTFKQAFERVQVLEGEVRSEQRQREELQLRSQELEKELANCRGHSVSAEKRERRLQQELHDLRNQFDSMKEIFEKHLKIFRGVHRWLFVEPCEKGGKVEGGLDAKKAQKRNAHRRRELLREFGPGLAKLLNVDLAVLEEAVRHANNSAPLQPVTPSEPVITTRIDAQQPNPFDNNPDPPPLEPSGIHPTSRSTQKQSDCGSLALFPITNVIPQELSKTPKPIKLRKTSKPHDASDTEEDAQASPRSFKAPLPVRSSLARHIGNSSDTEDDSQAPNPLSSPPRVPPETPLAPTMKPIIGRLMRPHHPAHLAIGCITRHSGTNASGLRSQIKVESEDDMDVDIFQDEPPAKRPRISLDPVPPLFKTPRHSKSHVSPRGGYSTGDITRGKRRYEDENTPIGKVPAMASSSKQTKQGDYTTYKGRGRYAKNNEAITKTINSLFTINSEQNGGMNHQYDEVVRGREERLRMDGGDCECCRDYYAAVGPLPPRDQGPLWRSPSTTPIRSCKRHGAISSAHNHNDGTAAPPPDHMQAEIEAHKKLVSRHRHNWARAQTPPGYWNIGFPTTQEAHEINERAEEMHQKKLEQVEKEAQRGRYLRR